MPTTTPPVIVTATKVPATTTTTIVPPSTTTIPLDPLRGPALETVAEGLTQPTVVTHSPTDDRLHVVERTGTIRTIGAEGAEEVPFLDIADRVTASGIEQGMLGLAFHPDGSRFFVYYVNGAGNRTLSEFRVGDEGAGADSERVLFSLPQPEESVDIRHYGGNLVFGPDGYLYVSLGDGADARGQGQDPSTPFGALLRLDVDSGDPYGIPDDNPFVAGGGVAEVWAYGLRNPWRFTIDPVEGLLYVADVGQETWEEVNVLPMNEGGANLGWPSTEGNHCFLESDCDLESFTEPVFEYGHDEGCSITGGHVYRGSAIPELVGHYSFADWGGGWVRSFRYTGGEIADPVDWEIEGAGQVNAFELDSSGELYLANFEGRASRIIPVR